MQARVDNSSKNNEATIEWYKTAVTTAVVGGVFSLIVLVLVIANFLDYLPGRVVDPEQAEEQWEELKVKLRDQPNNEQLVLRIRQLDLQMRQERIRRQDFSRKGGYLLLGSVVVFLIGAKWVGIYKKKIPAPKPTIDLQDQHIHQAMWARWAVTAGLLVLGSGALLLSVMPKIDFGGADISSTLYPSMEQIRKNWPCFRGPGGLGISTYTNIPTIWNGKTGEGILWKSKVPLPGHNSPVIWDDRVFLSGANGNNRKVYCFDALSGELLWQGDVPHVLQASEEPFEVMEDTGYAAPTIVTDGRRVCAIFATGDVGCFDFAGKRIWARNLGIPDSAYGYASSLAMHRNLILIQYDQASAEEEKSKLIALDVFSGNTVWETKRPVSASWSSPIIAEIANQYQIVTCSDPWVIAYEPANGAELWRAKCLSGDMAPSPISANGLIFAIEPYTGLVAIRPDGRGDVTKTHIAWKIEDLGPDICSPVSDGELIFLLATEGILACYKVADGTKLWEGDIRENFMASPSLVDERVYILSEDGVMFIVEADTNYKQVSKCELGEKCYASPAFADGRIYIRGLENLYCIGKRD